MKIDFRPAPSARSSLRFACLLGCVLWIDVAMTPSARGQTSQQPAPTRAFQPPTAARAQAAAQSVMIVATIGFTGACLLLLGTFAFYRPRAWQQPILPPTPIPKADAAKEPDAATRAWETRDRYDIEGEIGDFLRDQWPE